MLSKNSPETTSPKPLLPDGVKPYYEHNGIAIVHADCREVLPLLALESVDLVLTDPPYGDNHDTDYSTQFSGGKLRKDGSEKPRYRYEPVEGDTEKFDPAPLLKVAPRVILFGANRFSNRLPVGSLFVWDKRTPLGSKGVMSDAEVAWYNQGRGVYIFSHMWDGFNRASERHTNYHPTQKPVALMRWCILRARLPAGSLIIDPYMGSGPVLEAAKQLGYRAIGIDTVETYCFVAARRLQQEVLFTEPTP